MRRTFVVVVLVLFGFVQPCFSDVRALDLRVVEPPSAEGFVALEFQWHVSSDLATLSAMRSDGAAVHFSEFGRLDSADEASLGTVLVGQIDRVHVEVSEEHPVTFAITWLGEQDSFQLVGTLRRVNGAVKLFDTHRYRISEVRDPERPATTIMQIEPLDPKTAATIFGEDGTNVAIADATGAAGECSSSNPIWAVQRRINFSTAPAAATADAIAVHVMITHPNMSHLEVAFFEETSNTGFFLWNEGGGVNLNQTFTQSLYGQPLPGIGEDVNGWYQLTIRDCTVGTTGTLTYWSVEVTYSDANAIDLVANTINVSPNPVEPGADVSVEWEGRVAGSGTVSGPFNAGIYLSTDSVVTTGDTLLTSVNIATATNPGDTFGDGAPGRTVSLPGGLTDGTYFVGVIIDTGNSEPETDENNNVATTSLQVQLATVDLVADSLTMQNPEVAPGGLLVANWFGHVAGTSTGPVPSNYTVGFYLSQDSNVTGADLLLDRETVNALNPGDSFGGTGKGLVVPAGTAPGTWTVGMWVDDTEGIAESNESNNLATATITVTGATGSPDLVPMNCSVSPSTAEPGDSVTVQFRATNPGTEAAVASTAGVYLSTDTAFQGGTDQGLATAPVAALSAGQNGGNQSVAATIPGGTADGTWYALVVLDINGNVSEGNEGNNVCSAALTVQTGGGGAATRWLIPAVASAEGAENSDWRSQTTVVNPTSATRSVTYYYVASGQSWPGTLLRGPVSLSPSQADFLEDPLVALRPTSGLVYVDLDDEGPVVTSRTYNLSPGGATFGQGIPALPLDGSQNPSSYILPMVHSGDGAFRTNLGLVQADAGNMTVRIDIYTATGVLLTSTNRSQTAAWQQINDLFDKVGLGASVVDGGWIRVTKTSGGSGAWTCYASVVDDQTGDPTFVAPIAE